MKLSNFKKSDTLVSLYVDSDGLKNGDFLNNCLYSIAKQKHAVDLVIFYNNLTPEEISSLDQLAKNPVLVATKTVEEDKIEVERIPLPEGNSLSFHLVKTEATKFAQIFNLGFNYAVSNEYEFYSIVEQEDVIAVGWYDYASSYFSEDSKMSVALPLIRNVINGVFNGVINEASWVEGLSEEAGITDINLLLRYNIVNILGAVFRVSMVQENSEQREDGLFYPFKESVRLTHTYEFFLRMIYNDLRIKTIPRICYELKFLSKPMYSETSSKVPNNIGMLPREVGGIEQKEIQFYVDLAKKEYFFDKDRKVVFNS